MSDNPQHQVSFHLHNKVEIIFRGDDRVAHLLEDFRRIFSLGCFSPESTSEQYFINLIHEPGTYDRLQLGQKYHEIIQDKNTDFRFDFSREDGELYAISQMIVSTLIGAVVQHYGGGLIHGALGEINGKGFLMAAPGGTGKSTASSRLPAPFVSHCDDTTLILKDEAGNFRAHPFPTWSRFFWGGAGGTWQFDHALPLNAVFYLSQSKTDHLASLSLAEKTTRCVAAFEQASRLLAGNVVRRQRELDSVTGKRTKASRETDWFRLGHDGEIAADRAIRMQWFENAREMSATVPAVKLQLSLHGTFWELIQRFCESS